MHDKLNDKNKEKLTEFINDGIDKIYLKFDNDNPIHPETLNILIRAIQVYNNANETSYPFPIFANEDDPNNMTVHFMNNVVRKAAQRGELFDRTRDAYTRAKLAAEANSNMEEVDGGAKRKRTKRRHKRKHQRKSKRVKKVIH